MNILTENFFVNDVPPKVCLLFLHGLGSDGHDMMHLAKAIRIGQSFVAVCPTASEMNITINHGMPCNAWFDILDIAKGKIDYDELLVSVAKVDKILDSLVDDYDSIVLLGFSQGGAVALTTGLLYDKKILGIAGLSTFFPNAEEVLDKASSENKNVSILLTHGEDDETLDIKYARDALGALENAKINAELKTYTHLGHSLDTRVIDDLQEWLKGILPVEAEKIEDIVEE